MEVFNVLSSFESRDFSNLVVVQYIASYKLDYFFTHTCKWQSIRWFETKLVSFSKDHASTLVKENKFVSILCKANVLKATMFHVCTIQVLVTCYPWRWNMGNTRMELHSDLWQQLVMQFKLFCVQVHRYMAGILLIRCKTQNNQSIIAGRSKPISRVKVVNSSNNVILREVIIWDMKTI